MLYRRSLTLPFTLVNRRPSSTLSRCCWSSSSSFAPAPTFGQQHRGSWTRTRRGEPASRFAYSPRRSRTYEFADPVAPSSLQFHGRVLQMRTDRCSPAAVTMLSIVAHAARFKQENDYHPTWLSLASSWHSRFSCSDVVVSVMDRLYFVYQQEGERVWELGGSFGVGRFQVKCCDETPALFDKLSSFGNERGKADLLQAVDWRRGGTRRCLDSRRWC